MSSPIFVSNSIEETHRHAAQFAGEDHKRPLLILLEGDLGAGKTEWSKAFISKILNDKKLVVTSPTYSLVNAYKRGNKSVYHFDLYRLTSSDDLESIGFWGFLRKQHVLVVEWGNMLPPEWPKNAVVYKISFRIQDEKTREIEVKKL